jgi:hypothetical protein
MCSAQFSTSHLLKISLSRTFIVIWLIHQFLLNNFCGIFKGKWNCLGSFTSVVFIWISYLIHQQSLFELSCTIFFTLAGVYVQAGVVVADFSSRRFPRYLRHFCSRSCIGSGTPRVAAGVNEEL